METTIQIPGVSMYDSCKDMQSLEKSQPLITGLDFGYECRDMWRFLKRTPVRNPKS